MDKIAAEIFAPLLANMAGKALKPSDSNDCIIKVPRVEVALCDGNPRDPDAHWHCGYLNEEQTQRLYELLLEDPAIASKADAIAEKLATGEMA